MLLLFFFYLINISSSELLDKKDIYRFGDSYFIGNKTYNIEEIRLVTRTIECEPISYTHVIIQTLCFPVYIKNKICQGLHMLTVSQTAGIGVQEKCSECTTDVIVEKKVHMLCKKKKQTEKVRYEVITSIVNVVDACSCT